MGYEGWSDVADYCTLRRVLELRDSPLAGECAAIIKAHRPDARCADIPLGSSSGIRPVLLLAPSYYINRSTPTPAVGFSASGHVIRHAHVCGGTRDTYGMLHTPCAGPRGHRPMLGVVGRPCSPSFLMDAQCALQLHCKGLLTHTKAPATSQHAPSPRLRSFVPVSLMQGFAEQARRVLWASWSVGAAHSAPSGLGRLALAWRPRHARIAGGRCGNRGWAAEPD